MNGPLRRTAAASSLVKHSAPVESAAAGKTADARMLGFLPPARIAKGEWRNGPLPSVKQLQQEHDVGRDTVLRAIDILRTEGLVFTVPRRGTYVSQDTK